MALKILLVDDSRLVRVAVNDILNGLPNVLVCGQAENGEQCLAFLESNPVDLIIMDVEMPVMDGLTALKKIKLKKLDVKVIMLSTLTVYGALTTFRAMDLGAIDFVPKPSPDSGLTFQDIKDVLINKIQFLMNDQGSLNDEIQAVDHKGARENHIDNRIFELLVIGISTGGPPAIEKILMEIPAGFQAPIIIVQHMPPVFTKAFAERLNELCALNVSEALHNEKIIPGHVYIAPGNYHLRVSGTRDNAVIQLDQGSLRNSHRPSIDITMESIAEIYKDSCVALIMTGMGQDGKDGMSAMNRAGALTMAQDKQSSVIYGMNRRAIESGVVEKIVALDQIPGKLCEIFNV